jgi:hypothetical protein
MDRRIIAQLYDCIDGISSLGKRTSEQVNDTDYGDGKIVEESSNTAGSVRQENKLVVLIVATNK